MSDDPPLQLKPRLEISIDQAQAIIDRVAPGSPVAAITELHGGEISTILEITRADAPSCILKVYPAQLQWKMAKEVYVLGLVRDAGIAIPRILMADDSRALIDLNFVLMSKLDGVVLGNREAALTDQELFSIYAAMGAALRHINGITLDSFGYIGPHGVWTSHPTNRAYMSAQFERKLTEFCTRGGDEALAARLRAGILARSVLLDAADTPRLCHYDFHAGNVLVTPEGQPRLTGIVDFENATAGDPLMDVAKALYYFTPKDAPKRDGLLAGYGASDRSDWEATIALYRLASTLELWCWFAQIGKMDALPKITEELERAANTLA
ncbi:aminoglycoside phosphotransferase (APT) family kinase protein [Bradyrhizobium japonicum]|uniref:phosphotransferase family protein n=1 Tax=Bradyrhizobium elkanii TaxID=29448 RepID=UPI00036A4702|nr:aminoglycoside phosphotransferase family protein [Bradyrhizobium elkanii]MCP1731005.1 aminoglycoside phosphotransferase (APT) family kinase protein [Bradyrhizobium elkanii]MCP1969958.1 aminoglycoside phosphotransferase (APT) family kinase protein [Bradyrhizobium elkanii]MCS3517119.1 aminoglycoside phosphotransferase (APT) family kinase protein [Bradyrhizobium elkanii]MCS3575134.1 aminoglycoside phosphotransferase (APT) family kinase protein [Bradyrhizobium elkanii]MCS3592175.1 aminoglycosid